MNQQLSSWCDALTKWKANQKTYQFYCQKLTTLPQADGELGSQTKIKGD